MEIHQGKEIRIVRKNHRYVICMNLDEFQFRLLNRKERRDHHAPQSCAEAFVMPAKGNRKVVVATNIAEASVAKYQSLTRRDFDGI